LAKLNHKKEKLAGKIRISQQAIAKWENDKSFLDPIILIKLAELFEETIDYLLT
jgi:transcriptional regulator with XRE-family HTH domain